MAHKEPNSLFAKADILEPPVELNTCSWSQLINRATLKSNFSNNCKYCQRIERLYQIKTVELKMIWSAQPIFCLMDDDSGYIHVKYEVPMGLLNPDFTLT